jgi:DeoR/GlpR family transcriptional regulator of sugar metabolism
MYVVVYALLCPFASFLVMNGELALSNIERQRAILRRLETQLRISVPDVCAEFGVSETTARRDLESLAGQGLLQRIHGGAILARRATPESPMLLRSQEQSAEKQRIGRSAAALVQDGDTVFLGSGTTVLEVARNLRGHRNLTVLTNSLPVLNTLVSLDGLTLVGLGGVVRDSELSLIGHITEQALAEVRADRVIMGIRALSLEQGLTNDFLPETLTDRAIQRIGGQVIVVADHTKCGAVAAAYVAPLTAMQVLVTDDQAPPEFVDAVRQQGIEVVIS